MRIYIPLYIYIYVLKQLNEYETYMKYAYILLKLNSWKDAVPFS